MRGKAVAFSLFFIVLVGLFSFPSVFCTTENRFFRSSGAYDLGTTSGTAQTDSAGSTGTTTATIGIRVWKTSTEITSGTPVAQASIATGSTATLTYTATWACPQTSLSGDYIIVEVYIKVGSGSWYGQNSGFGWQTEALNDNQLDAATWTVGYTVRRVRTLPDYTYSFRFGIANANITNFQHSTVSTSQWLNFTQSQQIIVQASQSTSQAKSMSLGSSIIVLSSGSSSCAKEFSSSNTVYVFDSPSVARALGFTAGDLVIVLGDGAVSKALMFQNYDIVIALDNSTQHKELELRVFDLIIVLDNESMSKSVMLQAFDLIILSDSAGISVAKAFLQFEVFDIVRIVDYVVPLDLFDLAMNFFDILICVPFAIALGIVFRKRRKRKELVVSDDG